MTDILLNPGLEGVILDETRLSLVDGERGELIIGGYPLQELAPNATFEETIHLLWSDRLPTVNELEALSQAIGAARALPDVTWELLRRAAAQRVAPMDALRMAASTLTLREGAARDASDAAPQTPFDADAIRAVAALPLLVAGYRRLLDGAEPLPPRDDLGYSAHFLYLLDGAVPDAARARALDTYLNTVVDHGLNASTFTARTVMSTGSDLISALVAAIGSLKGPLHGGAPGPALDMVFEIGSAENAEPFLRRKLEAGERLMGFGHRVYKVRDPRAAVLGDAARRFYSESGDSDLYQLAHHVEETAVRLLEEYKPGRRLQTNVEFYTALLLHGLGIPTDFFTPVFAIGRTAGWIAHALDQQRHGRLIRPRLHYVGERQRKFLPATERG